MSLPVSVNCQLRYIHSEGHNPPQWHMYIPTLLTTLVWTHPTRISSYKQWWHWTLSSRSLEKRGWKAVGSFSVVAQWHSLRIWVRTGILELCPSGQGTPAGNRKWITLAHSIIYCHLTFRWDSGEQSYQHHPFAHLFSNKDSWNTFNVLVRG